MFLGNLSTATEHTARKKSGGKKKSKTDDVTADDSNSTEFSTTITPCDVALKRLPAGSKPIIYTIDNTAIPRTLLLDYFSTISQMLLEPENMMEIINDSIKQNIGLHVSAVNFQKDVMQNNFQIEKEFGCQYLSMIPMKHSEDLEVILGAKDFMFTAMKAYVATVRLRKERVYKSKMFDGTPMSRTAILEFFEACNAYMAMPEAKKELRDLYLATGALPNAKAIDIQHGFLVQMGYTPEYGVSCLNKINQIYRADREVTSKLMQFAKCAELSVSESAMSDIEREQFYDSIPPMMHSMPHIYLMQKQAEMMQQRMAGGMSPPSSQTPVRANDIEALKSSGILSLMSSPEGRLKMQELAGRIQQCKGKVENDVGTWEKEKKKDYFNSFATEHPIITQLSSIADPLEKINTFINMSDADLESMMTVQEIISTDISIIQEVAAANSGDNTDEKSLHMKTIANTIKTLSNFKYSIPPPNHMHGEHNHDHSHGHGGHECAIHSKQQADISTGNSNKMDR
eukprot:gene9488-12781_t